MNRVGDNFVDQFEKSGHAARPGDIAAFANLGITVLRQSVAWERVCPVAPNQFDWTVSDRLLGACLVEGLQPIVGLVHHGSGPAYTNLLDPQFPYLFADYARHVAERYPWVDDFTPVNEPLTTARFSALYGVWYPHCSDPKAFATAFLNQIKAVVLSMEEIRKVNPLARLVQTEDLGKTHATKRLQYQADFENVRRWATWDLLCGSVQRDHDMFRYFRHVGIPEEDILWFADNPCMPDVIGINHYVTSERFLDHRLGPYPDHAIGGNGTDTYADIEAVRVLAGGCDGPEELLKEAWNRYDLPIAVTECHLGCTREEQARWLLYVWNSAQAAKDAGAEILAVTIWSLLGAYDWNSLLCRNSGCYESGVFDLRSPEPRATSLATCARGLALGIEPNHPVLQGPGWWERPVRLLYPPTFTEPSQKEMARPVARISRRIRPLAITGASGTLGRAFARICELRGIEYTLLSRAEVDLIDEERLVSVLTDLQPWALINTAGFVRVDDAEEQIASCFRDNTWAGQNAAKACGELGIPLVSFSSDLVFDGHKAAPYTESDLAFPLNIYGQSKLEAEARILDLCENALVVRTSSFFGPWDEHNFLHHAVSSVADGRPFRAAKDLTISPTYVPDLVHAVLDLLIDGETGIWHLANDGEISWSEFARWAVCLAGHNETLVEPTHSALLGLKAARPSYSVLRSERGWVMPRLEEALERWVQEATLLSQSPMRYLA